MELNLIDFHVLEVLGEPKHYKFEFGECWIVKVIATSYGRESYMEVYCKSEEEALSVKIGYVFQS